MAKIKNFDINSVGVTYHIDSPDELYPSLGKKGYHAIDLEGNHYIKDSTGQWWAAGLPQDEEGSNGSGGISATEVSEILTSFFKHPQNAGSDYLTELPNSMFRNYYYDYNNVEAFASNGFGIQSLSCPNVTKIGSGCFENINHAPGDGGQLRTISLPSTEYIAMTAFHNASNGYGCTLDLGTNVKYVGMESFMDCTIQLHPSMLTSVETIMDNAFTNCVFHNYPTEGNNGSFDIPCTELHQYSFNNTIWGVTEGTGNETLTFTELDYVPPHAFEGFNAENNGKLSFPKVTEVNAWSFDGINASEVSLPKVTVIQQEAFRGCSMTSMVFDSKITFFGMNPWTESSIKHLTFNKGVTADSTRYSNGSPFIGMFNLETITFGEGPAYGLEGLESNKPENLTTIYLSTQELAEESQEKYFSLYEMGVSFEVIK